MNIQYIVHSSAETPFETTVQLAGQNIQAMINGLIVELVSVDGTMNRTLRITPENLVDAKELYKVGATILTSDSLAAPAPTVVTGEQV